jgi:hypothetical protein
MSADLVSIVIPCFNAEKWVGSAIQSALNQTHPSIEVLVVDDGSSDNSLDVIKQFGKDVRCWSGPNRGGCAARNLGLQQARGPWVQFLDADDLLVESCVASKLAASSTTLDVVCCDIRILDDEYPPDGPEYWQLRTFDLDDMLRLGSPQTAAPLLRTETLRHVGGFQEGLKCAQEYDLHLKLGIETGARFVSTGEVGVLIRPLPHGLSRSAGARMLDCIDSVLMNAEERLRERGMLSDTRRAIIAQRYCQSARRLWIRGCRSRAGIMASRAAQLSSDWQRNCYRNRATAWIARRLGFCEFERLRDMWRTDEGGSH